MNAPGTPFSSVEEDATRWRIIDATGHIVVRDGKGPREQPGFRVRIIRARITCRHVPRHRCPNRKDPAYLSTREHSTVDAGGVLERPFLKAGTVAHAQRPILNP